MSGLAELVHDAVTAVCGTAAVLAVAAGPAAADAARLVADTTRGDR